jgi:flagellar basal-body rod protein FlgB
MFDELDKINIMSSFYFERTKVIQGNIANANTPFYKPVDLTFEEVLDNQFASMSIISKIKTKKTENIELYYNYLAGCNDELSIIAKEMYESYKILQEVGK